MSSPAYTQMILGSFLEFWRELSSPPINLLAKKAVSLHADVMAGKRERGKDEPQFTIITGIISGSHDRDLLLAGFDADPDAIDCTRDELLLLLSGAEEGLQEASLLVSEIRDRPSSARGIENVRPHSRGRKHKDPKAWWGPKKR